MSYPHSGTMQSFAPLLEHFSGNVILATGEQDKMFTPAMLAHAASLLQQAKASILPRVAYAAQYEQPEMFADCQPA